MLIADCNGLLVHFGMNGITGSSFFEDLSVIEFAKKTLFLFANRTFVTTREDILKFWNCVIQIRRFLILDDHDVFFNREVYGMKKIIP